MDKMNYVYSLSHMIYNDFGDLFFPKEAYFGYSVRTGKFILDKKDDFNLLLKSKKIFSKSFYDENIFMVRSIFITTIDSFAQSVYFKYEEDIPYEVINVYRHNIVLNFFDYVDLSELIDFLNVVLSHDPKQLSILFNNWIDEYLFKRDIDYENENFANIKNHVVHFANMYIGELFTRVFGSNLEKLKQKKTSIVYKIYEMKFLNDKGIIKLA